MSISFYQVDAFTSEMFSGNPAGVIILKKWLPDSLMQQMAAEINLSETAFVNIGEKHLSIRWFTPMVEVDLCGHATLAAAHILFSYEYCNGQSLAFESRSGKLTVFKPDDCLILDFPCDNIARVHELPELAELDKNRWVKEIYRGKTDLIFVMESQQQVEDYIPAMQWISRLKGRGLIITAKGSGDVDFVSRFFAPQSGINEDPVTGSAHTSLTPYWSKKLNKNKMNAQQLSKRGGQLTCELVKNRVYIGGCCVTVIKGELFI